MNIPDFIPEYIRNIDCLDLTLAGMVDLMCYPKEAIERATESLKNAIERNNGNPLNYPFKYFAKVAYNYCQDKSIKPDWTLKRKKTQTLGIKDSDPRENKKATSDPLPDVAPPMDDLEF
jgi:hypothetical protein